MYVMSSRIIAKKREELHDGREEGLGKARLGGDMDG